MSIRLFLFSLFFIAIQAETVIVLDKPILISGQSLTHLVINESCITHLTRLRIDYVPGTGTARVRGFHSYCDTSSDRIVKLNEKFFVKADRAEHASQCHVGMVFFDGLKIDEPPKTFFPSNWTRDDLEHELGRRVQEAVNLGSYRLVGTSDGKRENIVVGVIDVFADDMNIRVIFNFYTNAGHDRGWINTMYPLLDGVVFDESMGSGSEDGRSISPESGRTSVTLSPRGSLASSSPEGGLSGTTPSSHMPLSIAVPSSVVRLIDPACSLADIIRRDDLEQLESILSQDVLPQAERDQALFEAVKTEKFDAVKLFTEHKSCRNSVNKTGETPLVYALKRRCKKDIIDILLPLSDLGRPDNTGKIARDYVPKCTEAIGNAFAQEELRRREFIVERGWNELIFNIIHEHAYSAVQEIGREECNPNDPVGPNAILPLMAAIQTGNTELVELLLSRGADPRIPAKSGKTALDLAKHKSEDVLLNMLETRVRELDKQDVSVWHQFQSNVADNNHLSEEILRFVRSHQEVLVLETGLIPLAYAIDNRSVVILAQLLECASEDTVRTAWDRCLALRDLDPGLLACVCTHIKNINLTQDATRIKQSIPAAVTANDLPTIQNLVQACADDVKVLQIVLEFALKCCFDQKQRGALAKWLVETANERLKVSGTTIVHKFVSPEFLEYVLECCPEMVNAVDRAGQRVLTYALEHSNVSMVRILLEHKASVKSADLGSSKDPIVRGLVAKALGYHEFMLAAYEGRSLNSVLERIAHSDDFDVYRASVNTAAEIARLQGYSDLARCLTEHSIKNSFLTQADASALCKAVSAGFNDVIIQLLKKGVKPTTTDSETGKNALQCAIDADAEEIFEQLLHYSDAEKCEDLFEYALKRNKTNCMKWIVAHVDESTQASFVVRAVVAGDDCRLKSFLKLIESPATRKRLVDGSIRGQPLLIFAVAKEFLETVKVLIDNDVSVQVNEKTERGEVGLSPLEFAIEQKNESIANVLIEAGASILPSPPPPLRLSLLPLHTAVFNGLSTTTALLLKKGADVNARVKETGMTPLIIAAKCGNAKLVRMLLANNADPNLMDANGGTALATTHDPASAKLLLPVSAYLRLSQHLEQRITEGCERELAMAKRQLEADRRELFNCLTVLSELNVGISEDVELMIRISKSRLPEAIRKLRTLDFYSMPVDGITPLAYAISGGMARVVELLLDSGASIKCSTTSGGVPVLAHAIQFNQVECAQMLIEKKSIDVNEPLRGYSALFFAIPNGVKGDFSRMVKMLLEHGARRGMRMPEEGGDLTVAEYARAKGHLDLAKLIETWPASK